MTETDVLMMLRVVACEVARLRLPHTADYADVLQEAALGYLRAMERFDPARGLKPQTLGARRARGAVLDYLREIDPLTRGQRKRVKAGAPSPVVILGLDECNVLKFPAPSMLPDESAARAELERRVAAAMRTLSDRDWQVVSLTFWCGLTLREIGRRLGIHETRASELRKRALKRLRAEMETKK